MKRLILLGVAGLASLALVAFATLWFSPSFQDGMIRRVIEARASANEAALKDEALHVIFCGTGSPMPDASRAQACIAVYAGGRIFLIDAGVGGWNRMAAFNLPVDKIAGVLFTHYHSDHIGGLPDIAFNSWAAGRREALPIYGPAGIADVAAGFERAYAADSHSRIDHHGKELFPPVAAGYRPVEVSAPDRANAVTVHDEDGLKITAFRVTHEPLDGTAFGYRIDYKGRSVIFSGDTSRDENLARFGKGVDVMVHEALAPHMVSLIEERLAQHGDRRAQMMRDILHAHTSPVEAAELANEAGAGLLVYSHIVPPLPNAIARRVFLRGVSDVRPNNVLIGFDGLHLEMPIGSKKIVRHDLR